MCITQQGVLAIVDDAINPEFLPEEVKQSNKWLEYPLLHHNHLPVHMPLGQLRVMQCNQLICGIKDWDIYHMTNWHHLCSTMWLKALTWNPRTLSKLGRMINVKFVLQPNLIGHHLGPMSSEAQGQCNCCIQTCVNTHCP
jgi:hypothetical protein